jgi:hypothetical protein
VDGVAALNLMSLTAFKKL